MEENDPFPSETFSDLSLCFIQGVQREIKKGGKLWCQWCILGKE